MAASSLLFPIEVASMESWYPGSRRIHPCVLDTVPGVSADLVEADLTGIGCGPIPGRRAGPFPVCPGGHSKYSSRYTTRIQDERVGRGGATATSHTSPKAAASGPDKGPA